MNCFEWQNRSSDYLDGALASGLQAEADEHLGQCVTCKDRLGHYRQILTSIGAQPKSALPRPIRKAPLAIARPRFDIKTRRSRWQRAPWFVRTSVEGIGIAFIILFVVAMVPRVRTLYERSIERRLDGFNLADLMGGTDSEGGSGENPAVPLSRGKLADLKSKAGEDTEDEDDEFAEGDSDDEEASSSRREGDEIRVGSSEIWRFNVKTDSPHELRPKIVQLLGDLHVPPDTAGLGGIEAPGGIQFDILVNQGLVPGIKSHLQKLAGTSIRAAVLAHRAGADITGNQGLSASEAFTWYKNKSRRKIPPGKARVVIWLSLI